MKLTKSQLRRIIKEELNHVLSLKEGPMSATWKRAEAAAMAQQARARAIEAENERVAPEVEDINLQSMYGAAGSPEDIASISQPTTWRGKTIPAEREAPTHMRPEYGMNPSGRSVTSAEYESQAGVPGSGVSAGPYQDPTPAYPESRIPVASMGDEAPGFQKMGPAQEASFEPRKRYMGMSVRWLRKRGWRWDPRLGDYVRRNKSLRQHIASWKSRRRRWNVRPGRNRRRAGKIGGLPTSQD